MSGNSLVPQDLTGQLSDYDPRPKFTGNYSNVYLGSLNGTPVAIKAIKATGGEDSVKRKVLREITLWAGTNHQNIHPFYGFVSDAWFGPFGALVSPWCSNGDATEYLSQNGDRMVVAERTNLWRGVIEGVAYLHQHSPVIVHGDLKPGNVLIDDLGAPRICDFGLARVFLEAESTGMTTTSEHTGTERYLAPELVMSEVTVYPTTESDVYALGCLGLQFIYDQKPYANRLNNLRGQIVRDIRRNVQPATSAPRQSWACQHAWSLIQRMWSHDPRHRPSAFNAVPALDHTARSLPLVAVQRIVLFSATFREGLDWSSRWMQRTQSLLTLSLVSRSFYARATPFLYQDIRIFPAVTPERLSTLENTLRISIKSRHTLDDLSSGYGCYTRTLLLCSTQDLPTLPADIQRLLDKMNRLQTLVICTPGRLRNEIPVHYLSTVVFQGANPLLILNQGMPRVLLPFQRIYVGPVGGLDVPIPDITQLRQTPLLPNLQDIDLQDMGLWGMRESSQLFHVFQDWVMPRLDSLTCTIGSEPYSSGATFTRFLQTQGPLLRYLKLKGTIAGGTPLASGIVFLCSNLRSLVVISPTPIDLTLFPPHVKLEILEITDLRYGKSGGTYLDQFDKFTSLWRTRFPNLRVARYKGPEVNTNVWDDSNWLEMFFRTEDSFYALKYGKTIYKRWEGKWIGSGTPTIPVET